MKTFSIFFKNKKIKIQVSVCNYFQKIIGLMFTRKQKAKALLFDLKKPLAIHSFFVFFSFYALWLDKENKVLKIKKIKPFTFHIKPRIKFSKILEIPINKKYKEIIKKLQS
ncbi:hypothetical protein DRN73_02580 [Candidatus Pacearchaeota archaeon]|nr:MAG: hypothetical protein DRN73_02580 [Candidatus Pacearchaeota archaeon]